MQLMRGGVTDSMSPGQGLASSGTALPGAAWWPGPLDVEAFLVAAATDLAGAVERLAVARGRPVSATVDQAALLHAVTAVERLAAASGTSLFSPWSGFFPCQDGWIRLHGNYDHHAQVIAQVLGVSSPDQICAAVSGENAGDVESALIAAGGVAGQMSPMSAWSVSAAGAAVRAAPLVWQRRAEHRVAVPTSDGLPLAGLTVVDLTRVIAGPAATAILAELGATVVRVDPPHLPEDPVIDQAMNGAKKRRVLNVASDTDRAAVWALLEQADIAVLGYRPGALARWGLDARGLTRAFPALTVGSVSAWGEQGPWADRRGFDSVVQAVVGIADVYASDDDPGGRPGRLPIQALDHAAGIYLAAALVDGVAKRGQVGPGRAAVSLARMGWELMRYRRPQGHETIPDHNMVALEATRRKPVYRIPITLEVR